MFEPILMHFLCHFLGKVQKDPMPQCWLFVMVGTHTKIFMRSAMVVANVLLGMGLKNVLVGWGGKNIFRDG